MSNYLWKKLAQFLAKKCIAEAIISYAKKTPYFHLPNNEEPSYMERYWVFNPYDRVTNKPRFGWLCPISIRVHHIKREDHDRALHDHPWNARTIILKGWYVEKRLNPEYDEMTPETPTNRYLTYHIRRPGDTAKLGFGQYHTIVDVSDDGVYTLFFSGKWRGVWGFLVNSKTHPSGQKIPWQTYLGDDGHVAKPEGNTPHG